MEPGNIEILVFVVIIGIIVGYLLGKRVAQRQYLKDTQYTQGTLSIDCSDPEFEPGLFLGLAVPVKDVIRRRYVTLDVEMMPLDSQQ